LNRSVVIIVGILAILLILVIVVPNHEFIEAASTVV
jgi:uncharacterized integral membrane protein